MRRASGAKAAPTFDGQDHCTVCHLERFACERVMRLVESGRATAIHVHPGCDHVTIYRSAGLWTVTLDQRTPYTKPIEDRKVV